MSNIVCIYHSVDLDGQMSAAVVKHWFNSTVEIPNKKGENINTIDFLGWNYGGPIPDLSEYDKIIMCDISFPIKNMMELIKTYKENFIYIDHHQRTINELILANENNLPYSGLVTIDGGIKYAACELVWQYFFPKESTPEIIRLLGMYDSFRHKSTNQEQKVLEFQYGAIQAISNYNEAYKYLQESLTYQKGAKVNTIIAYILNAGIPIYQYLCTEAKQIYKNAFPIMFQEKTHDDGEKAGVKFRKFFCVNHNRFNPINFNIDYHKEGYDGFASFYYDNNKWAFSLYNDNGEFDVSNIAKQFGGGGHAGASGFGIDNIEIFLNNHRT